MIPETDQWKLDGDCSKCRRKKYCSKLCTTTKDVLLTSYYRKLAELFQKYEEKEEDEE